MYSSEYLSTDYLHLNSCGIEVLNYDRACLRKNGRVDYHTLYIYKGRCFATKYGREIVADEGTLILYRPGERQQYRFSGSDNSVSCYLHFSGTECEKLMEKLKLSKDDTLFVGKSGTLKNIMEKMILEHSSKRIGYEEMCNSCLLEFFSVAVRKATYNNNPNISENIRKIDAVRLLMHENFAENLPLKFYADYANLSLSRFAHLFKDTVGMTPINYITKIKINKAINLLNSTNMTIGEISERTGFSDQNYFGITFKKVTGISPKAYRKGNF